MRNIVIPALVASLALVAGASAKGSWQTHLDLAQAQLRLRQDEAATRSFRRARRAIRRVREEHLDLAMALLDASLQLSGRGKTKPALELADEARGLFAARRRPGHPDLSSPHLARGNILIRMERWADAEAAFRSALACLARARHVSADTLKVARLGLASAIAERRSMDLFEAIQVVEAEFGKLDARPSAREEKARKKALRKEWETKAFTERIAPADESAARARVEAAMAAAAPALARFREGGGPPESFPAAVREAKLLDKGGEFFGAVELLLEEAPPEKEVALGYLEFHDELADAIDRSARTLNADRKRRSMLVGNFWTRFFQLAKRIREPGGGIEALREALRKRAAGAP